MFLKQSKAKKKSLIDDRINNHLEPAYIFLWQCIITFCTKKFGRENLTDVIYIKI